MFGILKRRATARADRPRPGRGRRPELPAASHRRGPARAPPRGPAPPAAVAGWVGGKEKRVLQMRAKGPTRTHQRGQHKSSDFARLCCVLRQRDSLYLTFPRECPRNCCDVNHTCDRSYPRFVFGILKRRATARADRPRPGRGRRPELPAASHRRGPARAPPRGPAPPAAVAGWVGGKEKRVLQMRAKGPTRTHQRGQHKSSDFARLCCVLRQRDSLYLTFPRECPRNCCDVNSIRFSPGSGLQVVQLY